MLNEKAKTIENTVMDTGFVLKGDFETEVVVAHDILDDTWVVESYTSQKLKANFVFESFDLVIKYLLSKEDTLLPSLGEVYDDIIFVIENKSSGVFYADSKCQLERILLTVLETNTLIK